MTLVDGQRYRNVHNLSVSMPAKSLVTTIADNSLLAGEALALALVNGHLSLAAVDPLCAEWWGP